MSDQIDFELRLGAAVKFFATNADALFDAAQVASSALDAANEGWLMGLRRRPMLGRPAFAIAVAVIAFVGLAAVGVFYLNRPGLVGVHPTASPVPSVPSVSPSPLPGYSRFTSSVQGIALDYPSGWQTRAATEPWTGLDESFDSPKIDVISDPSGDGRDLIVASAPTANLGPVGWSVQVEGWLCGRDPNGLPLGRSEPSGSVDGVQSYVRDCESTHVATMFIGRRGYVIGLVQPPSAPASVAEHYDYRWLRAVMDTVDLRPEDALPVPAPSPAELPEHTTFTSPLYGVSIAHPSSWQVRPATEPWTDGKLGFDSLAADVMFDPAFGRDLYLLVASQPLSGESEGSWIPDHRDSPAMGLCRGGGGGIGNGFQGNPDWAAWFQHCQALISGQQVLFTTPTHGYVIYLHDANSLADSYGYGEGYFDALLSTVRLNEANQ
jgi:hypothetical protein